MLAKFKGTKYEEVLKRVELHARVRDDLGTTSPDTFQNTTSIACQTKKTGIGCNK